MGLISHGNCPANSYVCLNSRDMKDKSVFDILLSGVRVAPNRTIYSERSCIKHTSFNSMSLNSPL